MTKLNKGSLLLALSMVPAVMLSQLPAVNYAIMLVFVVLLGLIRHTRAIDTLLVVACMSFLIFSTYSGRPKDSFDRLHPEGPYNTIMKQFLSGHIHMPQAPDPRLATLKNPQNPADRGNIPVAWDISYYKGKYYLYWGAAPAIALALPYHVLTKRYLSEQSQALFWSLVALFFGYLLCLRLIEIRSGAPPGALVRFFTAGLLTFGCAMGQNLRTSAICEISIFAGAAFALTGFYLLVSTQRSKLTILIAGCMLSMAVGSRATMLVAAAASFFMVSGFKDRKQLFLGMLPGLAIVGLYNYSRFDSPFEFGFRLQLNHIDMANLLSLPREIFGVLGLLFQPAFWIPEFPFLESRPFGAGWLVSSHSWLPDAIVGVFFVCPFLFLLLGYLNRKTLCRENSIPLALILCGGACLAADATAGMTPRYSFEIAAFLLPATIALVFGVLNDSSSVLRRLLVLGLAAYTINSGFFMSFMLHYGGMKQYFQINSPKAHKALVDFYSRTTRGAQPDMRPYYMRTIYTPEMLMKSDRCGAQENKREQRR